MEPRLPLLPEDPDAARAALKAELENNPALRDAVFVMALKRTRQRQDADDLCQDAILIALDPKYRAINPAAESTEGFLGSRLNGAARNRWRSSYMKYRADQDDPGAAGVIAPHLEPEHILARGGRERRRDEIFAGIRKSLAGHPIPLAVLDLTETKGIKGNIAMAKEIGCSVQEVENAKAMIKAHGRVVVSERPSTQERIEEEKAEAGARAASQRAVRADRPSGATL
jgi:DNA-directed RNA polymerase specialized sigma24 family protein